MTIASPITASTIPGPALLKFAETPEIFIPKVIFPENPSIANTAPTARTTKPPMRATMLSIA